ncbi:hypothetical protein ACI1US_01731 [Leucobacter sp. BZR 635]
MRAPSAKIAGSGALAVLLLAGGLTAGVPGATPASAVPVATYEVTVSGDDGPGSFGAAIEAANASPGHDTIHIADGLSTTITALFEVTETVTIVGGEGSKIISAPDYRGTTLAATNGATINLDGVTFTGRHAYGGFIRIAATDEPTTISNVTISDMEIYPDGGSFLHFDDARGSITVADSRFEKLETSSPRETSVIQVDRLAAPLAVSDSVFSFVSPAAVSIGSAELPTDAGVVIERSTFEFAGAGSQSTAAAGVLRLVGGAAQPAGRAVPAVQLSDTTIANSATVTGGAVSVSGLHGDVAITDVAIVDSASSVENAPVEVREHQGEFDLNRVTIETGKGTHGPAHSLRFSGIATAAEATARMRVVNSTFVTSYPDGKSHLSLGDSSSASLDHVTLVGGGVLYTGTAGGQELALTNSIISGAAAGAVVAEGTGAVSGSHNTVTALGALPAAGNDVVADEEMRLSALADHGGKTRTVLPERGSPAIDAALDGGELPALDQRGFARVYGAEPDRGAVEVRGGTVTLGENVTVQAGEKAVIPVTYTPGEDDLGATVRIDMTAGTATPGQDMHPVPLYTVLTFEPGGPSTQTFEVPTYIFNTSFDPLTFFATITEVSPGAAVAEPGELTVFIVTALPAAPTITDPKAVSITAGKTAEFSVTTTGSPAPEVTWEVSNDGGKTWESTAAAWRVVTVGNESTLTVPGELALTGYVFRATATDPAGRSAVSGGAVLTVTAAETPDPDPTLPDPGDGDGDAGEGLKDPAAPTSGIAQTGGAPLAAAGIALLLAAFGAGLLGKTAFRRARGGGAS